MIRRAAEQSLIDALGDTPAVLLQGPRQSGKSTLAQQVAQAKFRGHYVTLDDAVALAEARENTLSFLSGRPVPLVLDEVQRAPELLLSIKLLIDKQRRPGSYLLTGSANVLSLPKIADSLAGRMEVVELMPFTQNEIEGADGHFVDRLFKQDAPAGQCAGCDDLAQRVARGGFPEPVQRATQERRDAWFASYVRTLLDRDVRDLANISGLTQMPRLLALLASRSGQSLNISSLCVETGIPHTTLTRYIDLLKALYLIHMVPAWSFNMEARLAKAPKAYVVDSGLLCYLAGFDDRALADRFRFQLVLESFVAGELTRLARIGRERPWVFHLRTVKQKEVPFVLEARDGRIIGIEVTSDFAVSKDHLEGLRYLQELAEHRFHRGIVFYCGTTWQHLGGSFYAAPLSALWS